MYRSTHKIAIDTTFESIKHGNQEDIETFQEEYNCIHIGLVKVGVNFFNKIRIQSADLSCTERWKASSF